MFTNVTGQMKKIGSLGNKKDEVAEKYIEV